MLAKLGRARLYWLLQIGGWATLALISLIFFLLDEELAADNNSLAAPILAFCAGGLGLTHAFRLVVKQRQLLKLPVWQLALVVVALNGAMAAALVGAIALWAMATGTVIQAQQDWLALFSIWVNTTIVFLIWTLIYGAVYAFRNYRNEEIVRLRAEQTLRESELARLKSQMNPHFVFNALNSIRALVAEDPAKAQQSITQLSHLLRGFLISDRQRSVTLAEELRTVHDYLELEKLRYEDRLQYEIRISDEALEVQVPTMMVQTLVENAIKHGISKTIEGGGLQLRADIQDGLLCLEIENSGELVGTPFRPDGGFGLANTRLRLQWMFGQQAQFDIFQAGPGRVVARAVWPAVQQPAFTTL